MMTVIQVTDMVYNFSVRVSFQTLSYFFLSHPFDNWPLAFALPAYQKPLETRFSHKITPVTGIKAQVFSFFKKTQKWPLLSYIKACMQSAATE